MINNGTHRIPFCSLRGLITLQSRLGRHHSNHVLKVLSLLCPRYPMCPIDSSSNCVGHLVTTAAQPDLEQCGDLQSTFCKKYLIEYSSLLFPSLFYNNYMPYFWLFRSSIISIFEGRVVPYEYHTWKLQSGALCSVTSAGLWLASRRWDRAELNRVCGRVGEG